MYGIDTGNGGEFINHQSLACRTERDIRFTRGRPYRKVYDLPRTRYERLMESAEVSEEAKEEPGRRAGLYNPVTLKLYMDKARKELLRLNREKATVVETSGEKISAGF
jgi:hypothetical protein